MTAEAIARVVADLRAGRVVSGPRIPSGMRTVGTWACDVVVDASALYRSLVADERPVYVYEDHPCIAPPWDTAAVCYVNEHGNVIVMVMVPGGDEEWVTNEPVDWDEVGWRPSVFVFIGGRDGTGRAIPVYGPVMLWQNAVHHDGRPLDLHWAQLDERFPIDQWDMAQLVLLGTLNFMNCRNVELVEPARPRSEQRRLARTGVTVSTVHVTPSSRWRRAEGPVEVGAGTPLTSVRGHFAKYGVDGRLPLFGKYVGRFWRPQHARGSAEHGEAVHDYEVRPEPSPRPTVERLRF